MSAIVRGARRAGPIAFAFSCSIVLAADDPLDLEGYVQVVLRAHPAVRQAASLELAALAERKAAHQVADPSLEFSWDRAHPPDAPGGRRTETGFTVTQTIPWPGTFKAGVRAGESAGGGLRASGEWLRWEIQVEARRAFAQLLSTRAILDIARSAEKDARALRDLVARRADLGESREADRIKATVEWLRQQRGLRSAEREAEAAEVGARTLAVAPLPRPLALRGHLPSHLPPPDAEALRTSLLDGNPKLRAARFESERRDALLSMAKRGRVPGLDVSLFRQTEIDKESTGFSVGIKVPLWNANRAEIARATAGVSLAAAESDRVRLDLTAELETRLKDLEVALGQAAILEEEILPAAQQSLNLARFAYEEGETSLLDLLDAERTYREAQRETVEACLALALAVAEMQRLVGPNFNPWR